MKFENGQNRRLRYGGASVGIVAAVIAVVLLLNLVMSAVSSGGRLFIDLTSEAMYTLSDGAKKLLGDTIRQANETREDEDPVQVKLIFCADPDLLYRSEYMRYIYYTALGMQNAFPETIRVEAWDVLENPSKVDAYRTNSYSSIYPTNVIVASGTEFRVYDYKKFYTSDQTTSQIVAYSGEKNFLRGILAVTRAEAPVCALTVNHGEPFATEEGKAQYREFLKIIESAGYEIEYLDLSKDEIPENCRLVITFDPKTDFLSDFSSETVSEIDKLEKHLRNVYSYMVFADADTPKLPVWEEFLQEWGITIGRFSESGDGGEMIDKGVLEVVDPEYAIDSMGEQIIARYETESAGTSITGDMLAYGNSPKVVFGNAVPLMFSPIYQLKYQLADSETGQGAFTYGYAYINGEERTVYDVFRTGESAYAYAKKNGERLTENGEDRIVDTTGGYRLMTLSCRDIVLSEGNIGTPAHDITYVCAIGSTDFASNEILSSSAYGNTDVLLSTLRMIGCEVEPVGLDFKLLYDYEIADKYYKDVTQNTDGSTTATDSLSPFVTVSAALLIVAPGVILAGAGIYVLLRRKFRS